MVGGVGCQVLDFNVVPMYRVLRKFEDIVIILISS